MNARQYYVEARDAAQSLRRAKSILTAKRQLCIFRARTQGATGRGGVTDPTKRIDDLLDYESKLERDYEDYLALIRDAVRITNNYIDLDEIGGLVLWYRFIECLPKREVALAVGIDYEQVEPRMDMAFDRIDSEGLAAIREGKLRRTGAEE